MDECRKPKYNFQKDSDPIRKIMKIYPIYDAIGVQMTAIPISDEFAYSIGDNTDSLCDKYDKDVIIIVDLESEDSNIDYADKYLDNDDDDDDDEDEYEDYNQYDDSDDVGNYSFQNILPDINFDDANYRKSLGYLGDLIDFDMIETFRSVVDINSIKWLYAFKFINPTVVDLIKMNDNCIKKSTRNELNRVSLSVMAHMCGGVTNIPDSSVMQTIIEIISNISMNRGRSTFAGFCEIILDVDLMDSKLKTSYDIWLNTVYNLILEDCVDYDTKYSAPVYLASSNMYYKRTDFLSQYYFPKGIKIRKDDNNECKEADNSIEENRRNSKDNREEKDDNNQKES